MFLGMIDLTKIFDVTIDGIKHNDAPDYVDAYISEAWINDDGKSRQLTDSELDWLNEQDDYRYEQVIKWIY